MTASAPNARPGLFDQLDGERWLARRLSRHGVLVDVLAGVTTPEDRKTRVRDAIRQHGLELIVCGKTAANKPITYEQAFERLYGEAL